MKYARFWIKSIDVDDPIHYIVYDSEQDLVGDWRILAFKRLLEPEWGCYGRGLHLFFTRAGDKQKYDWRSMSEEEVFTELL